MQPHKTLLLVGGGHAHALFLQQWHKQSVPGVELIVIDPHPKVPYTGMLPGFVAGHYQVSDLYIDLQQLTIAAGGKLVTDSVMHIDPEQQTVRTASGRVYQYDVLSVDIGIHAALDLPGFAEHAVGVKPLYDFATQWEEFVQQRVVAGQSADVVVIGGGVAGVELALAARYRLIQHAIPAQVTIVEQAKALQTVSQATQKYLRKVLHKHDIDLVEGVEVTGVSAGGVQTKDNLFPSDFTLAATGPRPHAWLANTALACTDGYLDITRTLQTPQHPTIFSVGDCAHFLPQPLQKAGVYAVRQAPVLHHNLTAYLQETPLQSFRPQRDYLKLISLGEKKAAADKWGWCWRGVYLWQLKHYIDTAFMKRFT
jgi:selenide,water dikinase